LDNRFDMSVSSEQFEAARQIVLTGLRTVLPPGTALPADNEDWIESGLLDSMAHVEVLMQIERSAGVPDLFAQLGDDAPTTIQAAVAVVSRAKPILTDSKGQFASNYPDGEPSAMTFAGWAPALGSQSVPIEEVEQEFGLPAGKLSQGAGLKAVCRASTHEDESSLAQAAAQQALDVAGASVDGLDWILATSETALGFPSLGASLHSALLAPQACSVLDVGGGCAGVVNALIVADALFAAGKASCVLMASADVHSRTLVPGKVPGEFGGLFGDGASAFVLRKASGPSDSAPYRLVKSIGGCVGAYASAIQVRQAAQGGIDLKFDGEALAHAAVDRMAMVLSDLEVTTGRTRDQASAFVIHQPNPRVVEIFIRRAKLLPERLPIVTRSTGNLGSTTCGLGLCRALEEHGRKPRNERGPIFMTALGPGLLWVGALLD
jgi:3-oxoacyl-[acyl-carrier-protein] synthase-3